MTSDEEYLLGKRIVLDRIFEQRTPLWGASEQTSEKVLFDDEHPLILQKKVVFFVTKPKVMDKSEFDYIQRSAIRNSSDGPGLPSSDINGPGFD